MKTFQIYCLKTPEGAIRYFGQTCQRLRARFNKHLNTKLNIHVSNWIQECLRDGKVPLCELLMSGLTKEEADQEEKALIKWGKLKGLSLTNTTDGGDGMLGVPQSEANRKAISERMIGKKKSPESIEKMRLALIGRKHSEATRLKMSLAHRGNKYNLGKTASEQTRKKRSMALKGRVFTEEHRRQLKWSVCGRIAPAA